MAGYSWVVFPTELLVVLLSFARCVKCVSTLWRYLPACVKNLASTCFSIQNSSHPISSLENTLHDLHSNNNTFLQVYVLWWLACPAYQHQNVGASKEHYSHSSHHYFLSLYMSSPQRLKVRRGRECHRCCRWETSVLHIGWCNYCGTQLYCSPLAIHNNTTQSNEYNDYTDYNEYCVYALQRYNDQRHLKSAFKYSWMT
jgi:hypothetical protein